MINIGFCILRQRNTSQLCVRTPVCKLRKLSVIDLLLYRGLNVYNDEYVMVMMMTSSMESSSYSSVGLFLSHFLIYGKTRSFSARLSCTRFPYT